MKNALLILIILYSSTAMGQRIKLVSGSLQGLKDQLSYDIKFSYDSMIVGIRTPEQIYLDELKARWEAKETGKGDYFVELWFDDRKSQYEPAFIKYFEKYSKVKLNDKLAKYTIIVKTKSTEGGWTLGPVSSHPGEIAGELWIVESADSNKIKAKIIFQKLRGEYLYGGDFEMTTRIKSAYIIAGKFLGFFLKRKSK